MSTEALLRTGAATLGLSLDELQIKQLMDYLALLMKWNRVYNLTAIRDETGIVSQHLLDSLAVAPYVGEGPLIDVGSGAGLPGMPIAVAHPQQSVTLLDSNDKKCAFMRQAAAQLKLSNVSVCLQRVEGWEPMQKFSLVVSRAFAELRDFVQWTNHLLSPKGQLLALKGHFPQAEIDRLPPGFAVTRTERLEIPTLAAERHLVWIERV